MDFTTTIDDSNVDVLSRRLGWTDQVQNPQAPLGALIPNPIDQSTWIANKAGAYLNNELEAAIALPLAESGRQQGIQQAQAAAALNSTSVTKKTTPPITPPLQ